jgi:prepilin-type processing-associated H-X9-DG protein
VQSTPVTYALPRCATCSSLRAVPFLFFDGHASPTAPGTPTAPSLWQLVQFVVPVVFHAGVAWL